MSMPFESVKIKLHRLLLGKKQKKKETAICQGGFLGKK
jgi:hypothetical protein